MEGLKEVGLPQLHGTWGRSDETSVAQPTVSLTTPHLGSKQGLRDASDATVDTRRCWGVEGLVRRIGDSISCPLLAYISLLGRCET